MDIKYNAGTKLVTFNVAGTSTKVQNVTVGDERAGHDFAVS